MRCFDTPILESILKACIPEINKTYEKRVIKLSSLFYDLPQYENLFADSSNKTDVFNTYFPFFHIS